MRKVSRASDSIWHTASPDWDAEYAELKAKKDGHRADAAKLSDRDLQDAHDDLADDIELNKHNEYPFLDHLLNNVGPNAQMPEKTEAQKAHDDLRNRREAFGDELDARGLWGPKAEAERQKMVGRMDDWPKNYSHRENLINRGILQPEDSYSGEGGFDKYMSEAGFDLPKATRIAKGWKREDKRRTDKKMTRVFGYGGFDGNNPEHRAIVQQMKSEYGDK